MRSTLASRPPVSAAAAPGDSAADGAGSSPFVGVSPPLALRAATRLLGRLAARPVPVATASLRTAGELAAVVAGLSAVRPAVDDRRFRDPAYLTHPVFRRLAQGHLVLEAAAEDLVRSAGLDGKSTQRAEFVVHSLTEALAPSNALLGNPAALRRLRETRGGSLLRGAANAADDLHHHGGLPALADRRAFRVGVDLAATPGSVVFRDALFELIQYAPTAPRVAPRPLLFVPSQVNRFYAIDLTPQRSLVRFLLAGARQPFAISWRNPTTRERDLGLDDYVAAVRRAVHIAADIAQAPVDVAGLCAGGATALLATAGWDAAEQVASLTLAVTVADTSDPTLIGAFTTRPAAAAAAAASRRRGVLTGTSIGRAFAFMRPRDLVWNLWVSNYLLGQRPPANDVLFWSDDTTDLPARLHADFLDVYVRNPLGAGLLGQVGCDAYVLSGLDDHIAPWTGGWRTATGLGGDTTYVAAAGGHIQALLAVPDRAGGYTSGPLRHSRDPHAWLASGRRFDGSWWEHWTAWLAARSGAPVGAPARLGSATYPVLYDAPGRYVHER